MIILVEGLIQITIIFSLLFIKGLAMIGIKDFTRRSRTMASIRDVAWKAGVGIGTVSRALNGTGYVAEETKMKILEAVKELDFRPNELAKNLNRNRSGLVGVMIPDLGHPFFAALIKYIEVELHKRDYKCMICNIAKSASKQKEYIEMLKRNAMDGIISCSDLLSEIDIGDVKRPMVCMDRSWGSSVPNVHSDHKTGGMIAAEEMIKAGCKNVIQFMPEVLDTWSFGERHFIFQNKMKESGVRVKNLYVPDELDGYEKGAWASSELLKFLGKIDGIFSDDLVAIYCLKTALEQNVSVPKELKIMGYDGIRFTEMVSPTITTIYQDLPEIARLCVKIVIEEIEGVQNVKMEQMVKVKLLKGQTV